MAINFPNSPSVNDIHSEGGIRWKWIGSSWTRASGAAVTDTLTTVNDNSTTTLYPVFTSGTGAQTAKVAITATKSMSFDASDGDLTVAGNVSIGGTLTYEDVKNVDSVGIITARSGVYLPADDKYIKIGASNDLAFVHTSGSSYITNSTGHLVRRSDVHKWENYAGNTEYIRIGSSGQIGIAGANYGSSGQVLTSQGSGSAVAWSTIAGLTYFTESANTSSPNNSVAANRFIATGSGSNIDAIFQPKGTGALLAQLPDNATSGGNKRGARAVDWQMVRSNANQVASGEESVIGGGENNKVTGNNCTISGGHSNIAGGGYGSIAGGYLCETTGQCSTVTGGCYNKADASYSTVIGVRSKSRWEGHITFGATSDSVMGGWGGQQAGITIYQKQTTNATATTISSNIYNSGDTSRCVTLPNNSAYGFTITVVAAVTGGGNSSMWKLEGLIKRGSNAASTALVGNVVKNRIAYDSGASAWDVAVTANTSSGFLVITVTGQASTTIRWMARIETTELTYS